MNCKDFEREVFLLSEISDKQKEALKLHMESCEDCLKVFKEVTQIDVIIKSIAAQKNMPNNATKLTNSIMEKIHSSASLNWIDHILNILQHSFTRIALGSLSTILLITFSMEFFNDAPQINSKDPIKSGFAILDSKLFREETVRQRTKTNLFTECTSPFKTHEYVVNCIKSKLK